MFFTFIFYSIAGLVEEFTPPPPGKTEGCKKSRENELEKLLNDTMNATETPAKEEQKSPDKEAEAKESWEEDKKGEDKGKGDVQKKEKDAENRSEKDAEKKKEENERKEEAKNERGLEEVGACQTPWLLAPSPLDSRSMALEKHTLRLQCEMGAAHERYNRLAEAMDQELTDLKKLNYAMVTRMQRLESLLRSMPRMSPWP